jgi:hypothetical protein
MQYFGTTRIGKAQNVAYTASVGAIANGVSAGVTRIRIMVTTDAFVTTDGTDPSTTNGAYLPAASAEYFTVNPGEKPKAVQVAAGGTMYITECP